MQAWLDTSFCFFLGWWWRRSLNQLCLKPEICWYSAWPSRLHVFFFLSFNQHLPFSALYLRAKSTPILQDQHPLCCNDKSPDPRQYLRGPLIGPPLCVCMCVCTGFQASVCVCVSVFEVLILCTNWGQNHTKAHMGSEGLWGKERWTGGEDEDKERKITPFYWSFTLKWRPVKSVQSKDKVTKQLQQRATEPSRNCVCRTMNEARKKKNTEDCSHWRVQELQKEHTHGWILNDPSTSKWKLIELINN